MRLLFILAHCLIVNSLLWGQKVKTVSIEDSTPIINFFENEVDFGEAMEGEVLEYTFKFINKGNETLVISNILTSCGCTVVNWTREPVSPGKRGEIVTKFNTKNKIGPQTKSIIILSNSANNQDEIKIIANIIPRTEANNTLTHSKSSSRQRK